MKGHFLKGFTVVKINSFYIYLLLQYRKKASFPNIRWFLYMSNMPIDISITEVILNKDIREVCGATGDTNAQRRSSQKCVT